MKLLLLMSLVEFHNMLLLLMSLSFCQGYTSNMLLLLFMSLVEFHIHRLQYKATYTTMYVHLTPHPRAGLPTRNNIQQQQARTFCFFGAKPMSQSEPQLQTKANSTTDKSTLRLRHFMSTAWPRFGRTAHHSASYGSIVHPGYFYGQLYTNACTAQM
jgi:hypothetical protein